ncbi:type II/IV secretion system protein [Patescibacteria group bacterium]|nr:MAG: type II/IV secretion system protein [Patescibacteria group bacterium]
MADEKLPSLSAPSGAEKLTEKMREIELKAKEREVEQQAAVGGFPYINLVGFPISPEAIILIPKPQALELKVLCFLSAGEEVRIAAVNPGLPAIQEVLYQVEERTGAKGAIYVISEHSFETAAKLYDALPTIRKITKGVAISEEELKKHEGITDFTALEGELKKVNVTDIVTILVATALNANASDIHVEAEEKAIVVRYRLDGILHEVAKLPAELWAKVVSRIKLLSGLKINVTDRPQDGRFTILLTNDKIDVRVSMLPTTWGESVVMRILRASGAGKTADFNNLGIRGRAFTELAKQIERPNGMIITTGPTGSGKTTTLYSILKKLNSPEMKIITLEDPVEYKLEGINQSQIDHAKDYTFAKGLRSILRQDPDVVMVGEIRDLETAEIAIQAALTGHLVISTIHTNSAAGAIPRFLSMGVKGFLLAPALNAVIGQRLVRRICPDCIVEDKLSSELLARAKKVLGDIPASSGEKPDLSKVKFYKGGGCKACMGLGFKGRIGIYEIMIMDKDIEQIILSGEVSEYKMLEVAVSKGMVTMAQDGLLKALDKLTSVEEVFRTASED